MKRPFIFLGLVLSFSAQANGLQTPEALKAKAFHKEREQKARENQEARQRAKEAIKQERQERQEQESLHEKVKNEEWGKQGPKYVP